MPLSFHLKDLQEESTVLPILASKYLDPSGTHRIAAATDSLKIAATQKDRQFTWQIPEDGPIRTLPSRGEYESRNDGDNPKGVHVVGQLSFKWQMRTDSEKPVKSAVLDGNATTKIHLLNADDQTEISMWRMEIGPADAPGCCFHTQVLGAGENPPFPKWMPVPRLPSFPPTPMSCLEFLLGELFQRGWSEQVQRDTSESRAWRGVQTRRFTSFLDWQQRILAEKSPVSPLIRLKAFPDTLAL